MTTIVLAVIAAAALLLTGGFWHQQALIADSDACPTHLLLGRRDAVNRALRGR